MIVSPAGKALVITQVVVDTYFLTAAGPGNLIAVNVSKHDATCGQLVTNNVGPLFLVNPPTIGPITLPFDPGIVVPAGRALCAGSSNGSQVDADVFAFGYTIPSAAAPSGAAERIDTAAPFSQR